MRGDVSAADRGAGSVRQGKNVSFCTGFFLLPLTSGSSPPLLIAVQLTLYKKTVQEKNKADNTVRDSTENSSNHNDIAGIDFKAGKVYNKKCIFSCRLHIITRQSRDVING